MSEKGRIDDRVLELESLVGSLLRRIDRQEVVRPAHIETDASSGHCWVELDATLTPGSQAAATKMVWTGSAYTATGGTSITVYDEHHRNFGLDGEQLLCAKLDGRWQPVGENGLLRRGTPDANIASGASGTVSIAGSVVNITGYVDWAEGGEKVSISKEAWWKYQPDEEKWYWLGGECE